MNLVELLTNIFRFLTDFGFLFSLLLLTMVALYTVFALVFTLQIKRLNQTVNQQTFSSIFQFIALVNAILAVFLLLIVAVTI